MPEGIEKQLQPQELYDLFAFITLDKPPEDPDAKLLAGLRIVPGESSKPDEFPRCAWSNCCRVSQPPKSAKVESRFWRTIMVTSRSNSSRDSLRSLSADLFDNASVSIESHLATECCFPCSGRLATYCQRKRRDSPPVHRETQREGSCMEGNYSPRNPPTPAGQSVTLELLNKANDWSNEFGYWNAARDPC